MVQSYSLQIVHLQGVTRIKSKQEPAALQAVDNICSSQIVIGCILKSATVAPCVLWVCLYFQDGSHVYKHLGGVTVAQKGERVNVS